MKRLLDFLWEHKHWFLFFFLEFVSIVLIYRNNGYQTSVIFNSAHSVTGQILAVSGEVQSYFGLRKINKYLEAHNGKMEMQILNMQDQIGDMMADTVSFKGFISDSSRCFPYQFVMAEVVNNSIAKLHNYITIDKGTLDGIAPDMGVVSEMGVVGIVSHVSEHFSVVIPILNPKSRLSCKVLGNNSFGYLSWRGRDPVHATLEELPRHAEFQNGDTVVTSGYSAIFPPGLIVGYIEDFEKEHDDNFYSLQVRLSTSFSSLQHVRVIKYSFQKEQLNLEQEARKND